MSDKSVCAIGQHNEVNAECFWFVPILLPKLEEVDECFSTTLIKDICWTYTKIIAW